MARKLNSYCMIFPSDLCDFGKKKIIPFNFNILCFEIRPSAGYSGFSIVC